MMRTAGLAISLLLAAAAPGEGLRADDAAAERQRAAAEKLFRRGDRLVDQKNYGEALDVWAKGYELQLPLYRGLEFRRPVAVRLMEREKIREYMLEKLAEEYPDAKFEADQIALQAFGFSPPDLDLKKVTLDVLTAEIGGFYDPASKGLYLIEEKPAPAAKPSLLEKLFGAEDAFNREEQRVVLSHELTHALADQHYDLEAAYRSVEHDEDMALALSTLVEGEATLVMMMDMLELAGDEGRALLGKRSTVMDITMDLGLSLAMAFAGSSSFKKAPLLLKESLIFPYRKGYAFCRRLTAQGDWDRVDHAFREPPRSTEQILHPEKYLAALPDEPVALTFGAGDPLAPAEWSFAKENVLGEFSIEVLLRPQLGRAWSSRAAAGWDGDLYRVYRQKEKEPRRAALIWVSAWDSPEEAEEFAAALAEQQRLVRNEKSAAVPEGVPAPVALWGGANGLSGVWRRESRVWFLAGVPEGELSRVLDWSLEVESGPKTARERLPPDRVIRVREF